MSLLQDVSEEVSSDIRLKLAEIWLEPSGVHSAVDICHSLSGTINHKNLKQIQESVSFLRKNSLVIIEG